MGRMRNPTVGVKKSFAYLKKDINLPVHHYSQEGKQRRRLQAQRSVEKADLVTARSSVRLDGRGDVAVSVLPHGIR